MSMKRVNNVQLEVTSKNISFDELFKRSVYLCVQLCLCVSVTTAVSLLFSLDTFNCTVLRIHIHFWTTSVVTFLIACSNHRCRDDNWLMTVDVYACVTHNLSLHLTISSSSSSVASAAKGFKNSLNCKKKYYGIPLHDDAMSLRL